MFPMNNAIVVPTLKILGGVVAGGAVAIGTLYAFGRRRQAIAADMTAEFRRLNPELQAKLLAEFQVLQKPVEPNPA